MKPRLALDLDGVYANCEQFILDHFGKHYRELGGDYVWTHLTHEVPHIFSKFEVLPNVNYLLESIKQFEDSHDIFFLTAIPKPTGHLLTSAQDKEKWVRDKLNVDYPVHCVVGRQLKQLYAQGKHDILIDDHPENIKQWTEAGGHGILHSDVWKTIHELEKCLHWI